MPANDQAATGGLFTPSALAFVPLPKSWAPCKVMFRLAERTDAVVALETAFQLATRRELVKMAELAGAKYGPVGWESGGAEQSDSDLYAATAARGRPCRDLRRLRCAASVKTGARRLSVPPPSGDDHIDLGSARFRCRCAVSTAVSSPRSTSGRIGAAARWTPCAASFSLSCWHARLSCRTR
jgi:hypothetical protein